MDGYEFVQQLRAEEAKNRLERTPVAAVTANAMMGEEERCLAAGMDGYLAKPVAIERLRAILERWLPIEKIGGATSSDGRNVRSRAIDSRALGVWLGDDKAAIAGILNEFRNTAMASERAIDEAWRSSDLAALAAAAHRLKGAANAAGAAGVGRVAGVLEQAGKSGDRAGCREGLGPLAVELRQAVAEIDSLLH